MNVRHRIAVLPLLLSTALGASCARGGTHDDARASSSAAPAVVAGTVLDAATGEPLAGVRIEGPHGTRAVSARDGRFELSGLRAGEEGDLVAKGEGRPTHVRRLRPLAEGRLEIVIHLPPR